MLVTATTAITTTTPSNHNGHDSYDGYDSHNNHDGLDSHNVYSGNISYNIHDIPTTAKTVITATMATMATTIAYPTTTITTKATPATIVTTATMGTTAITATTATMATMATTTKTVTTATTSTTIQWPQQLHRPGRLTIIYRLSQLLFYLNLYLSKTVGSLIDFYVKKNTLLPSIPSTYTPTHPISTTNKPNNTNLFLGTFFGQLGQQKPGVARPTPLRLGTLPAASPPRERPPQRGAYPVRTLPVGSSAARLIPQSRV
ncbi:hypothetical protein MMC31_005537 [Peltigera leucophlebia]|nr:hypothetical protein [Peltigera leucophlebia]